MSTNLANSRENENLALISAFGVLVAPPPLLLMLRQLKPGYTSLLLQNMAGRPGGGVGKGCDHGVTTR